MPVKQFRLTVRQLEILQQERRKRGFKSDSDAIRAALKLWVNTPEPPKTRIGMLLSAPIAAAYRKIKGLADWWVPAN